MYMYIYVYVYIYMYIYVYIYVYIYIYIYIHIYICEIRLIDKTDPSDPIRREFFWMQKLKTLAPLGLNVVGV